MLINLLGIREVVVDLLVQNVEDDIQKVPSKQKNTSYNYQRELHFIYLLCSQVKLCHVKKSTSHFGIK